MPSLARSCPRVDVVDVAGVPIAELTMARAVDVIDQLVGDDVAHTVVTCNVDHMHKLQQHHGFRTAYDGASLVTADGAPVVWMARLLGARGAERVTGADLMPALSDFAARTGRRVAIVGGAPGVPEAAAAALRSRFPQLEVVLTASPSRGFLIGSYEDRLLVASLAQARPDFVFVCLGAPKQELWMEAHRRDLPGVVLLGVGAAVDFAAGTTKRAPEVLQRLGMEWMVRIVLEPKRLWRRYLVDGLPFIARTAAAELALGRRGSARRYSVEIRAGERRQRPSAA